MAIPITVPRLGWTMEDGTFVAWLKKDGEPVRAGEPLFTLEGDKASQEIEATESGVLRISPEAPKPGDTVRVGALLGYLVAEVELAPFQLPKAERAVVSENTPAPPQAQAASSARMAHREPDSSAGLERKIAISPRALRTALELGIDWTKLRGTGRTGRIRERDVLAAASRLDRDETRSPGEGEQH